MSGVPRDWLIGPTTFGEYTDRFLAGLGDVPPELRAKVEARASLVAAKLRPGDELWEWRKDGGPFSSAGGLAIVRGGEVVEWWREWVS